MQKIITTILIFSLLTGCSAARKAARTDTRIFGKSDVITKEEVLGNNLTSGSFYIRKAEISIQSDGEDQKFVATIRFTLPGEYLISLRSRTGIEAARIFVTKDTILANDRINRILYYGKPDVLSIRYGIPYEILPVLFGDYITGIVGGNEIEKCSDGNLVKNDFIKGLKLNYIIDCKRGKIIRAEREGAIGQPSNEMEFGEFVKYGGIEVPSQIKITDNRSKSVIQIELDKIERPWDGTIEFIPGNSYDLIELR